MTSSPFPKRVFPQRVWPQRLWAKTGRGGRPLRVGFGRIFHEACADSPLTTEREDFLRMHSLRGDALLAACQLEGVELKSFMPHAELTGFVQACRVAKDVEPVPLSSHLAVPNGPMSRACFDWLVDDLCGELQSAGPLDALYLALHGSMEVRGLDAAPEGVILARVRAIVGPDLPIAVSYDLHVNLAPELVDPAQIVIAYRSNPHWDLFPTGFRAGNRIIRVARQQVQPVHEWRKLAMVTGGGTTISFLPPMRRLFSALKKLERDDPRVLSASLCMVHPFTSAADLGWAVHICTDGDRALAAELADAFADRVWAMRKIDYPPFRSVEEALDEVAESSARRLGPVTLVDADDIVGAGATGGSTAILAGWMRDDRGLGGLFPIHDPAAVAALWPREVGEEVALTIHGTPEYDQPRVDVRGELHAKDEADFGRVVCLRVPSSRLGVNSFIAIAERPPLPISPSFWSALKVEVRRADLMVQKNFFHYRIFYAHLSFKHIGVMAGGATSLTRVQERAYAVPTYPVDDPADWRDQDRLLRAPSRERGRARPEPVA